MIEKINSKPGVNSFDTTQYLRQLEQEKLKLTRELHDSALQEQVIALRELDALLEDPMLQQNMDIKKKLLRIREQQASSVYVLRNFCQSHYTPRLAEGELNRQIQFLLDRIQLRTNIEIRYNNQWSTGELSGEKALHLYRIIQELLHNTEKHANASVIELMLQKQGSTYTLSYYDNGVGMEHVDVTAVPTLGIKGIYSRAECLAAEVSIVTAREAGFKCVLRIPGKSTANEGN